jgi:hypothetical protein
MDGGFRARQPAERKVASRPEPAYRQPEEPKPASIPLKPTQQAAAPLHTKERKSLKRFLWPILVIILALALVAGWFVWSNMQSSSTGIDESKYQAIFFTNGQVYFGKLHAFNSGYMTLTDVFYLQSQQSSNGSSSNPQTTSADQNNVQLIKLGGEIHGPEDEMIVSKAQMLFYENLKPDGKVSQSIDKFKATK